MNAVATEVAKPVKIDLGAGKNVKAGFIGVDAIDFGNGNILCNIGKDRWPWEDSSVDEAHCSHVLEHLTNLEGKWERVHFFNELWRVLKAGSTCQLIIPHWASQRYYGDPTHKEPFSEFGFYYLDKNWRATNAPHADKQHSPNGYDCDIECTWGWSLHPSVQTRNAEYQQYAFTHLLEARQDIIATLKVRKV